MVVAMLESVPLGVGRRPLGRPGRPVLRASGVLLTWMWLAGVLPGGLATGGLATGGLATGGLADDSRAWALDHVRFQKDGQPHSVTGQVQVKAEDGGLLLLGRDGVLWTIEPDQLVEHEVDDEPFRPLSRDEIARAVRAELPDGFEALHTANYVICYNTSRAYAQWCGALFERLNRAFMNFWTRRGLDLRDSELPLVAIVFADKQSYERYARAELGDAASLVIGYYSLKTNRMAMYDLTGSAGGPSSRLNTAQINAMLSQGSAEQTVATVIHEATHQVAFNSGLQTRYADIPLWLSEGIAVYFETPDLKTDKGWRTVGGVNRGRMQALQAYLPKRPADSLQTLVSSDERLRDPQQALSAYAEAWALTYFLIRQKPKQYAEYLKKLSSKRPLIWDKPDVRLDEFVQAFGDLSALDQEFIRTMSRLK